MLSDQQEITEQKGMKTRLVVLALVVMALFVGCAVAAIPPNATFETQGVKTTGSISVLKGSIATSQSMTMTVANNADGVNAPPLEPSDEGQGERQATNVYTEMTDAKNGQNIEYSQTFNADTANKVLGTNNVQAHRSIQYESDMTKDGRMTSNERIVMDLVGASGDSEDSYLCPFAEAKSDNSPAFCNIVQMGSSMDVTYANVVTDASLRDIQATADFPAEMSYNINAKPLLIETASGMAQQPTTGSITAFMDVHTQEGRGNNTLPEADFVYKESTTASGYISNFVKDMYYQDGALRI
jgi:hypothetical protein